MRAKKSAPTVPVERIAPAPTITCGDCDAKWPADTKRCPDCDYEL